MAEFIKSLAVSMNAAGLSPRATALFKQAMTVQPFRWGRKAKIIGGVCLAVALRESHRPISLDDIAFLLDEPAPRLKRTFLSLISLLKLNVSTLDPSVHISTLHSYLTSELQGQQDTILPSSLVQLLEPLSLRAVSATANSLCTLLARLSSNALHLPTPPTACAIFMLALEAENRATFKNLSELGQILGSRVHAGKGVVMSRYKTIQDEVHNWIEAVAWLEKFSAKDGRAKVSKRLVVARGLKDVVQFQEEIWQEIKRPKLTLDLSDDEESQLSASRSASPALTSSETLKRESCIRTRKRQKTRHFLQGASQFLLDPLSSPIPFSNTSPYLRDMPGPNDGSFTIDLPLTSFLLMAPSSSLVTKRPPTRLQKLAILRGGADEILDNELFDEGELEGMLRSEDQIDGLRQVLGWDVNGSGSDPEAEQYVGNTVKSRRTGNKREGGSKKDGESRKSRVNMEALAQFLQEDKGNDEDNDNDAMLGLELDYFSDKADSCDDDPTHSVGFDNNVSKDEQENESYSNKEGSYSAVPSQTLRDPEEEVLIDNWRPASPEGGAYLDYYDEEYD